MEVLLIHLPEDKLVLLNGVLIIADDDTEKNGMFPAEIVAQRIAKALGVKVKDVRSPAELTAPPDWCWDDVIEWVKMRVWPETRA